MKSSVITNEETAGHFVENYRFKVLLSSEGKGDAETMRVYEQNLENEKANQSSPEILPNDTQDVAQPQVVQAGFDSGFVEELLKKTDELSGNIIKLQMQIENQEAEFNRRLEAEVARAKEDGIAQGVAQESERFNAELAALNERFGSSVSKLTNFYNTFEEFVKKTEEELGATAVNVAAQVIAKEVSTSSSNVAFSLAKSLMSELKEAKNITLRVNPADANFLKEQFEQNAHVNIEADDAINKGGVVIISEAGNIDGSLETRLEKLKSLL
ncbi:MULTISPECIES: flagellar assembly protein FliH [unclassified Campylobacter]|uniref:flagellar assembly protein FliH n=1 Tax=unclassified Campylobacter TaxID=2593542 RepID=UPI003D34563D